MATSVLERGRRVGTERLRVGLLAPPWVPVPPPGYGGTEQVLATLADALVERGHDVVLVAATRNSALPIVLTPGLTLGLFALTLAMCTLSAISAIAVVTRIDPAMAFTR